MLLGFALYYQFLEPNLGGSFDFDFDPSGGFICFVTASAQSWKIINLDSSSAAALC